jgi:hypothetical protein
MVGRAHRRVSSIHEECRHAEGYRSEKANAIYQFIMLVPGVSK